MTRDFASFIKFGEKEHMEKLHFEGEVYCKPISYFNQIEEKDFRGDKNDGVAYLKQIKDIRFKHQGMTIATALKGQLYGRNPKDIGNIYCLFGLATENLNLELKESQKLNINLNGVNFGDTAVWIYDPGEFKKRVEKALKKNNYEFNFSPVVYLDYSKYEGELSPFTKSDIYKPQSEVRFWIPNQKNCDLKINIGNISDISGILPVDIFDKLEYEPI